MNYCPSHSLTDYCICVLHSWQLLADASFVSSFVAENKRRLRAAYAQLEGETSQRAVSSTASDNLLLPFTLRRALITRSDPSALRARDSPSCLLLAAASPP